MNVNLQIGAHPADWLNYYIDPVIWYNTALLHTMRSGKKTQIAR